VIAHRLAIIRRADMIFVVNDRTIVESAKHEELKKSGGLYSQLYDNNEAVQQGFATRVRSLALSGHRRARQSFWARAAHTGFSDARVHKWQATARALVSRDGSTRLIFAGADAKKPGHDGQLNALRISDTISDTRRDGTSR
jgi:hypothetical protein